MNKKVITSLLTMGMLIAPAMQGVSATSPITSLNGTDTHEVTATMDTDTGDGSSIDTSIVYSVDVTWGSMAFTYGVSSEITETNKTAEWNPKTHTYTVTNDSGEAVENAMTWTYDTDANKITVTNHSNAGVKADLSYESATDYEVVSGRFDKSSLTLANAEGTKPADAPKGESFLTLSGELDKALETSTTVGTVTVTLTAANQ